jgi:hypothetical protein
VYNDYVGKGQKRQWTAVRVALAKEWLYCEEGVHTILEAVRVFAEGVINCLEGLRVL